MYNVHLKRRGCVGTCRQYGRLSGTPIEQTSVTSLVTVADRAADSVRMTANRVPVSYTGDPNVDANVEPAEYSVGDKATGMLTYLAIGGAALAAWFVVSRMG